MANPTQYYRPRTLDEAVVLAGQPGTLAIAGGALAFGQMSVPYETFVDLQDVAELKTVGIAEAGLHIGAACTLGSLLGRDEIPAALKTALTRSISPHILNNTSVGEAILWRKDDILIEWFTTLVAMGAATEAIIPQRSAALREYRKVIIADERIEAELITALVLPLESTTRVGLAQVARTPAAPSIVCAAACVTFDGDGRVTRAMGATGDVANAQMTEYFESSSVTSYVLGSLTGWPLNRETIGAVIEEQFGSGTYSGGELDESYRSAMAAVCLERALEACRPAEE